MFEHRNYLPSVFLFLPVAQAADFLSQKSGGNQVRLTAVAGVLALVLVLEGYATFARNRVWRTEQSLWLDAAAKAPQSERPLTTLAILLAWGENPSPAKNRKALELTERTLSMGLTDAREAELLGNMASIYDKLGQGERAVTYYETALQMAPAKAGNRYNLAKALIRLGEFQSAREEGVTLLEQGAVHADYLALIGLADLWLGRPEQALPTLQKALRTTPGRPDILLYLGRCLSDLGHGNRAHWFFQRALEAGGPDEIVLFSMIQNDLVRGNLGMAQATFQRMLGLFPLPRILKTLDPTNERFRTVPIDHGRLQVFVAVELENLSAPKKP
jgi:tetratricopeptide (TPR) repeat protein